MQRPTDTVDFDACLSTLDLWIRSPLAKMANEIQFGSANRSICFGERIQFESKYGQSSGSKTHASVLRSIHFALEDAVANWARCSQFSQFSFRIAVGAKIV